MPSLFEGDTVGRWRRAEKRAEELRELARKAEPPTMEELNQQAWEAMKESDAMLKVTKVRPSDRIGRILSKIEAYWRKNPDVRLGQLVVNLTSLKHRSLTVPEIFYLEDEDLEELLECVDDSTISVQQKHPTNMDEIKSRLDNLHMLLDAVAHNTAQWKKQDHPNVAHDVASLRADVVQLGKVLGRIGDTIKHGDGPTLDSRLQSIQFLLNNLVSRLSSEAEADVEAGSLRRSTLLRRFADLQAGINSLVHNERMRFETVEKKLDHILEKLGEPMGPTYVGIDELPEEERQSLLKIFKNQLERTEGESEDNPDDLPPRAEYCGANPNRPYEDGLKVRLDPTTGRKYYVGADGEKKYFDLKFSRSDTFGAGTFFFCLLSI